MIMKNFRFAVYLFITIGVSSAEAGAYEDFFRAVANDRAPVVEALLRRGFDPNSPDERGHSALIVALQNGSDRVVAALLAHPGLQVDTANAAGETALMIAALRGDRAVAEQLLGRGAQVDREGWSPLHYAASGPATPLVALLLDRGAAIDARSPNGTTPLMMAARYGDERSALLLLERGADARKRNERELTAADFARMAGRTGLAERLEKAAR